MTFRLSQVSRDQGAAKDFFNYIQVTKEYMEWAFLSEYELAQKEEQELSCKLAVDQELDKI